MTGANGNPPCPSDYQLEAFLLEGSKSDHPFALHLQDCTRCQGRLQDARRVREEFRQSIFPATVDSVVERAPACPEKRAWPTWLTFAVGASAAMLLLVLAIVIVSRFQPPTGSGDVGIKGSVGLKVFCKRGDQTFQAHEGSTLLPGDSLRFQPSLPAAGYLLILSLDERGQVSRYFPASGTGAVWVKDKDSVLPGSTVLNEGRGRERIFALYSAEVFDLEQVGRAIAEGLSRAGSATSLKQLPLPQVDQASLLFVKGSP